jgi:hypothetical protein
VSDFGKWRQTVATSGLGLATEYTQNRISFNPEKGESST